MAQAIVELKGVGKSFRSADGSARSVLEGVDFRLAEGEIVSLLGQSGSGKSTMLRIMAGLINADAGEVRLRDQPLFGPDGLGLDSVDALQLVVALDKNHGLKLSDAEVARKTLHTVNTIAAAIEALQKGKIAS